MTQLFFEYTKPSAMHFTVCHHIICALLTIYGSVQLTTRLLVAVSNGMITILLPVYNFMLTHYLF